MQAVELNQLIAKYLSLSRFHLRKDLGEFVRLIGHQARILDIGSGSKKPYKELLNGDIHIGIDMFDPSDVQGDIKALPFVNEIADLVLCTEVLEHVPEPVVVLGEARRVLKKGQYLILTVPLLWGEHDYVDYQRWTEAGLRILLNSNGFEILTLRRRGGLFSVIGCMFAQIPQQVFGIFSSQKNWIIKIMYLCSILCVLSLPWLFSLFDIIDREKKFVLGFSVLCKRTEEI
jgi:SAM-dependent methyltransferase